MTTSDHPQVNYQSNIAHLPWHEITGGPAIRDKLRTGRRDDARSWVNTVADLIRLTQDDAQEFGITDDEYNKIEAVLLLARMIGEEAPLPRRLQQIDPSIHALPWNMLGRRGLRLLLQLDELPVNADTLEEWLSEGQLERMIDLEPLEVLVVKAVLGAAGRSTRPAD